MTQTERNRFTILLVVLIVLVIAGIGISRFRRNTEAKADILGVIQNQAVATYKDADGVDMQPSLSDISQLTVSGGVGSVNIAYSLGKRADQSIKLDVQFTKPDDDAPFAVFADKNGDQGTVTTKLKNVANGSYDISTKPLTYLSQVVSDFNYQNGKVNMLEYKDAFAWGDIDVSHSGKGDNKVNNADWAVLSKAWNTDDPKADYNGDGIVNNVDASEMLRNWNKTGQRFTVDLSDDSVVDVPSL